MKVSDFLRFLFPLLFLCVPHAPNAQQDEGKGEELSHVEGHGLLEIDLLFLQELDEEAEGEDGGEAEAEIEAGADGDGRLGCHCLCLVPMAVDDDSAGEDDEVGKGFVELGGMAWHGDAIDERLVAVEDECPGDIGGLANNLGVHQIAQANEARHGGYGDGNIVHHDPRLDLGLAAVEHHADDEADGAAVGCQAFVASQPPTAVGHETGGKEHLDETGHAGEVVLGFVEQAMPQACPDEHTKEAIEEEGVELLVLNLLLLVEPLHDEVGDDEPEAPQEAVPPDGEETNGECLDGGLPVDEKRCHGRHTLNRKCMMSPSCTT